MNEVPFALALGAGMLAAVNPCGFALLPAYLSYLVLGGHSDTSSRDRARAVGRAVGLTTGMTAGFVAVFGLFGLLIAPLGGSLQRHLPWFTIALGVLLAGSGIWLLAGKQLPAPRLRRRASGGNGGGVDGGLLSMVAFGAAYALASLGCTIGPFLAIVVTSFRSGSIPAGVGLFVTYAAGMGLVVGVAAVAAALARGSLVGRIRRLTPVLSRLGGAVVLIAGAYVAYYGWYEIRSYRGETGPDPIIEAAATVQRALAGAVQWLGAPGLLLLATGLGLATGGIVALARRRSRHAHQLSPPSMAPDR